MDCVAKKLSWVKLNEGFSIVITNDDWYDFKEAFITEKVDFFSDVNNITKENILNLLSEINEITEFDNQDETELEFPEQLIGNKDSLAKRRFIVYSNYAHVFGTIFYHLFGTLSKNIKYIEGISGAVSTQSMAIQATEELKRRSQSNEYAYGATLCFATLIERQLIDYVAIEYKKEYIELLSQKIKSGEVSLTSEDQELFDFLYDTFINGREYTVDDMKYDKVIATTSECYRLLSDNKIIKQEDKRSRKVFEYLIGEKGFVGFNDLIDSTIFTRKYDTRLVDALHNIYLKENMNLRNNLAHCGYGSLNYFDLAISYLLYGIFLAIII